MMLAIWMSLVILVAALATVMTLGWKRYGAQPALARVACVETEGCYPKVERKIDRALDQTFDRTER